MTVDARFEDFATGSASGRGLTEGLGYWEKPRFLVVIEMGKFSPVRAMTEVAA